MPIAYLNMTTREVSSGLLWLCSAVEEHAAVHAGLMTSVVVVSAAAGAVAAVSAVQNSAALSVAVRGIVVVWRSKLTIDRICKAFTFNLCLKILPLIFL